VLNLCLSLWFFIIKQIKYILNRNCKILYVLFKVRHYTTLFHFSRKDLQNSKIRYDRQGDFTCILREQGK